MNTADSLLDYNQFMSNFEIQPSPSQFAAPRQQSPALHAKHIRFDEFEALNTRHSTQQTAREDPRPQVPLSPVRHLTTTHITLVESPKNHSPPRGGNLAGRGESRVRGSGKSQRKFKSLKRIEWLGQSEMAGSCRPTRRHKIFNSGYFSKGSRPAQQNRTLNHHYSASNLLEHSQKPLHHPLKQSAMSPLPIEGRGTAVRFMDQIPLVENSRLVRVNSCSQIRPEPAKSTNKITFTYTQSQKQPPLQVQAQPLQRPPVLLTPAHPRPIYTSNVYPVYSSIPVPAHQQPHSNPAATKIKKPNSTQRKGTLIDQMKQYPTSINTGSLAYEYQRATDTFGSKITLSNNIRESLVCGSLATDRLKLGDSFSNIEEDNSQRYFDDEQADIPLGQRISYKNIEIQDENEENNEPPETHAQNIFSDFEQSRRQDREKQRQREGGERAQVRAAVAQIQSVHILEQSTLNLDGKHSKNRMTIPVLLIGLATLLLVIQLLS